MCMLLMFYQLLKFINFFINVYQLFINFYQLFINVYPCFINFISLLYCVYQLFINFYHCLSTLSTFINFYQLLSTTLSTFVYFVINLSINLVLPFHPGHWMRSPAQWRTRCVRTWGIQVSCQKLQAWSWMLPSIHMAMRVKGLSFFQSINTTNKGVCLMQRHFRAALVAAQWRFLMATNVKMAQYLGATRMS